MSAIHLNLKGVQQHIGYSNIANTIESNLKEYFNWALLGIGGFTNISIPTSGIYGADFSRLRPVSDPNYTSGQVWESRREWCFETGVNYVNTTGGTGNPQSVSVLVNGVSNTGYYINYPEGQIIFTSGVTGTVQANYSYRTIQFYKSNEGSWFRELQFNSFRTDSAQYLQSESGAWSVFAQNRVQMPAVIIESVPRGRSIGFQLGSDVLEATREIEFTVLADNPIDRNNIMDILAMQNQRKLKIFDINTVNYPLDYRGMLTGTKMYTDWIDENPYHFNTIRLADSTISQIQEIHPKLYMAKVRTTVEILA